MGRKPQNSVRRGFKSYYTNNQEWDSRRMKEHPSPTFNHRGRPLNLGKQTKRAHKDELGGIGSVLILVMSGSLFFLFRAP